MSCHECASNTFVDREDGVSYCLHCGTEQVIHVEREYLPADCELRLELVEHVFEIEQPENYLPR